MKQDIHQVLLRVPVGVHEAIKTEAMRQDRSVNWLICRLLSEAAESIKESMQQEDSAHAG